MSLRNYIVNTGTASPARIKNALSTRELESVTTVEGLRAVERLSFVSLPSGKLLLMLNSCSGADAHDSARPPLDEQVYFGCDINLQRVDPSDNWNRSQIQLLSSTDLPEVRGVGLWAEEKNGSIDRVILLLWSATCPTKEETCKCNKEDGCKIIFQEEIEPSCLSSFYEGMLAPNGARICQGTGATVRERNGECYGYSLDGGHGWECNSVPTAPTKMSAGNIFVSRSSAKDAAAWHATKEDAWERHGIRLGSSTSVPYGSLLLAEFDGNGVLQWIRTVADDAVVPYKQEQRASIVGGEITGNAGLKQTQFAVTVVRERWERKEEKVIVTPNCETLLLNSIGEPEKEQLQKSECESCLYSVASIHPETRNWASLCVSGRGPMQGISINGRLAVDSMGRYRAETQQSDLPDDSLLYYNDTGARLLPVGGGKWVLVWREVSWIESDIDGLNAKSATLKAALWVDESGLGAPVPLLGPVLEQRLMNPDAVSLSLHTAVLTVANYLDEEALAATVDLSNAGVPELSATTAVAGVYWGALFGQTYGHPLLRLSDASALWLGSIKENNSPFVGPSILLPDWTPSDTSRAVVISVEQGEQDCQGQSANTG
ncbi:hypothetical protein, conserved [Eimeria necatrix]|uniref:Uncharacterized protein n=1 Tax=Eimeria necatrix TaxID=51315 RepID=U6MZC5_9EIME|nr:hypothetical protein, conserved [Eimeria necatrix]CDJ69331.1 hypothetical protein, conserved [Eimeria necatrix]